MIKTLSYILAFIFILSSCGNAGKGEQPKSDSITKAASNETNELSQFPDSLLLVSSGQMSPYRTVIIDNIKFQWVKDAQGDTSFIGTRDKAFITPEGYKIGISLQQIRKKHRDKLQEEPGWGYFIELPSKWSLQFVVGSTSTDHAPVDTNKVTYIFMRH